MEIQHKITQEDVGRARRARELRHSTQINRIEHATIQYGYYYGRELLRMATTTGAFSIVFHVGPAAGGAFFIVFHVGPKLGPT